MSSNPWYPEGYEPPKQRLTYEQIQQSFNRMSSINAAFWGNAANEQAFKDLLRQQPDIHPPTFRKLIGLPLDPDDAFGPAVESLDKALELYRRSHPLSAAAQQSLGKAQEREATMAQRRVADERYKAQYSAYLEACRERKERHAQARAAYMASLDAARAAKQASMAAANAEYARATAMAQAALEAATCDDAPPAPVRDVPNTL